MCVVCAGVGVPVNILSKNQKKYLYYKVRAFLGSEDILPHFFRHLFRGLNF